VLEGDNALASAVAVLPAAAKILDNLEFFLILNIFRRRKSRPENPGIA